jgi:hypothetical protein
VSKLSHARANLPAAVYYENYCKTQALKHLFWKEKMIGKRDAEEVESVLVLKELPDFADHFVKGRFTQASICEDEEFLIQISAPCFIGDFEIPLQAMVASSKTLRWVGFIPDQQGYACQMIRTRFGKVLVVAGSSKLYATHVEKNLQYEPTHNVNSMKKVVCEFGRGLVSVDLQSRKFAYADRSSIMVGTLTDEMLDFGSKTMLRNFVVFSVKWFKSKIACIKMNSVLDVLTCVCEDGTLHVWNSLSSAAEDNHFMYDCSRIWTDGSPAANEHILTLKEGFLCVASRYGFILVFKWDDSSRSFTLFRELHDPTITWSTFRVSLDLQFGFLAARDSTGKGMLIWNLMSNEEEIRPLRLLHYVTLSNAQVRVHWSKDGSRIYLTHPAGGRFFFREFNLRAWVSGNYMKPISVTRQKRK